MESAPRPQIGSGLCLPFFKRYPSQMNAAPHSTRHPTTHPAGQPLPPPEWVVAAATVDYRAAVAEMEATVEAMIAGTAGERIWLVEHPPVLTAGTSARPADLVDSARFDVVPVGRGGRYTYHGPGQRVIYPMLDLGQRGKDVRRYVAALEGWAIAALGELGIHAFTSEAGTGIWVRQGDGLAKIGAIGVRVRRWISFHGLSINVTTDLSHYAAIVPCGIAEHGVTRTTDIVNGAGMEALDAALKFHLSTFLYALSDI